MIFKSFLATIAICGVLYVLVRTVPPTTQLAMQGGASTATMPEHPSDSNPQCLVGVGPLNLDLCAHFQAVIQSVLLDPIADSAKDLTKSVVLSTDHHATDANADIVSLHGTILKITDSFLILVVVLTGIRLIYEGSAFSWSSFKETLPQVLVAFLLAQMSLSLVGAAISLNNALIQRIVPSGDLALDALIPPGSNGLNLFADFLRFVEAIFVILLILEASVRLPIINLCAVLSSAGCFALAWKPTQRLGMLWLNILLSSVFIQFFQVLLLVIGLTMFQGQGQQNPYVSELGGIAVSFVALALPFSLYRWAIQPSLTVITSAMNTAQGIRDDAIGVAKIAVAAA